jgi:CRISPR/Cas system CSM-associated protein Csm3 (group 7 of RAMP superfamily)
LYIYKEKGINTIRKEEKEEDIEKHFLEMGLYNWIMVGGSLSQCYGDLYISQVS